MKTVIESLEHATRKSIQLCIENIESISRSRAKLLEAGVNENALVVSRNNLVVLIKKTPFIIAHQTIFRKLKVRPLLDPWEVAHFEERKHWPKNIEKYLKQFKADPHDTNLIFQIAIEKSMPLKDIPKGSSQFCLTGAFINDPLFNRTLGLVTRDVWGYNTFSGLFYDMNILEHMSKLDTAFNLRHIKSIIPVRIFSDFVEIADNVQMLKEIDEAEENDSAPLFHGTWRKLDDLRRELERAIEQITDKYPVLGGESEPSEYAKTMLNFYTMSPSEMIEQLGPNIICCPFEIPEKLRLVGFSNLWPDPIYYDCFGLHSLSC